MASWQIAVAAAALLTSSAALASDARELGRVTAKAAIVVDSQTGEVLFARNPTLPLPPASTTKLLTALIALRQLSPETVLSVSSYASSMPPSKAYLKAGWQLSARDTLYALLLRSANDAAVTIAEGVAGSVPAFSNLMNTTARSLGTTSSNFITPNGLPAANHYSSARDMAIILRQGLATPGLRDILTTRTAVIQPLDSRKRIALRSTNRLLWRDDINVIGKTGWTRQAKRCFVGAASAGGREVIVAVLGSNDLWDDVELLATFGLDQGGNPELNQRSGWQQASASAPLGTAWRKPVLDDNLVPEVIAPERASDERRNMRMAAATAPTTVFGRRGKATVPARIATAQGDGGDAARSKLRYSLHIGSFRSKARADQLRRDVSQHGYRAEVEPVGSNYRVTVPRFESREAASKAARSLGRTLRIEPVIVASR
jgi:D-alanyl-D-alanine carboxypeptidase